MLPVPLQAPPVLQEGETGPCKSLKHRNRPTRSKDTRKYLFSDFFYLLQPTEAKPSHLQATTPTSKHNSVERALKGADYPFEVPRLDLFSLRYSRSSPISSRTPYTASGNTYRSTNQAPQSQLRHLSSLLRCNGGNSGVVKSLKMG